MPTHSLAAGTQIEDATTGCRGCASGSEHSRNIFDNKYGQHLAAIQIAREERDRLAEERGSEGGSGDDDDNDDDDEEEEEEEEKKLGPVGAADGSSGPRGQRSVWADSQEEQESVLLRSSQQHSRGDEKDVDQEQQSKRQKRS